MKKTICLVTLLLSQFFLLKAQEWQTDINEALEAAKDEERNIILVFQGSDWCIPCMKLEKEIWSTIEFKDYAQQHYVLLKADFPRKKANKLSDAQQEKNNQLAEKYNPQGYFPLVVVLDQNGKALGTAGYKNASPAEYIALLNSF